MISGSRLRQARERLGLTYRDVERASYDLANLRGRPEFIIHISRLADIENRGVTPSLFKLYTLAVIYHLNPLEVCQWYDVPLANHFCDGTDVAAPKTHLAAPPASLRCLCNSTQASTRAALSTFLAWWKPGGNWKEPCSTARSTTVM